MAEENVRDDDLGLDDVLGDGEEIVDEAPEEEEVAVVATTEKTAPAKPAKELFSFDDLKSIPGVMVGDVGLEISRFAVERAKFTTSSKALISIVTSKVIAIKTHYNEDLGNFICFGGKCCEREGLAKVRYLFPVVVYDTNKKGVPISKELSFKVLAVGKEAYDDIKTIMDLNGDISKFDLLVTCKDEQFQKISLAQAGEARWRKSKDMAQSVVSFWRDNLKEIVKPVARTMTEQEYSKKMDTADVVDNTASEEVDFDKLFNED